MTKLTADTITVEQIREVWRIGCRDGVNGNPDTMYLAKAAENVMRDHAPDEVRAARARCAEILNARESARVELRADQHKALTKGSI